MRRFLNKLVLFAIIIGMIFAGLECWVRTVPNEYSYKYDYLEKNIGDIEVLCMGSSAARSGINPDLFKENAFNVAQVSQDLEENCAIIHKYIGRAKNLKTVILAILPMDYSYRMGEGIESWRLRKYNIYMDLNLENPKIQDRFELSNFSGSVFQIMKHIRGYNTVDCYEKGMGNDDVVENEDVKVAQGLKISKIHNDYFCKSNYDIIVPEMGKTIQECADHNVNVVLLVLPCYYTYYDNIDNTMVRGCDSISQKLEEQYANVTYINYYKDTTFTTQDFRNSNHLSQKGAKSLTNRLKQILNL